MIEIKEEDLLKDFDGFDVYDAETGERLYPSEVAEREDPKEALIANGFCFDWEGFLHLTTDDGRMVYIPRLGRYLLQINGQKYLRW